MLTKHILVPLDESKAAEVTFNDAAALARALGGDITLLEVVQPLGDVIKTKHRDVCIDREWPVRVRRAISYLLSATERAVWKEIPVRAALAFGEIMETVTNFARSHSIDFIVWPPTPLGEAASLPSEYSMAEECSNGAADLKIFEHHEIFKDERKPRGLKDAPDSMEKLQTQEIGG